ncbi:hypothetical protein AN958_09562 [Leucoagaricus sp. SymC.cos]|nr:hypothetical protein AN958_09562 [Leucoagaricus sp. SymC.cos]
MFSLLLLLAFTHSLLGAPPPDVTYPTSSQDSRSLERRNSSFLLDDSRTIWDIVWSCLATIFACTWVAVHPNIPSPKADWKERFRSRLMVMAYAWIAPECVTMWAMRQWVSARKLARTYNQMRGIEEDHRNYLQLFLASFIPFNTDDESARLQRWTLTHGFFAQMGGYMIFRETDPYWTLFLEDVDMERDMELVPYYTEQELMDRSKGDVLSKGVAMLQTVWFGIQYFTRVSYHLPLTELETMTLAFAALNIATYILWWHKPLNVQCPIRVYEKTLIPRTSPARAEALMPQPETFEPKSSLNDRLSIPVVTFDDIPEPDDEWEELNEIPWFPSDEVPLDDVISYGGTPELESKTLVPTPAFVSKELPLEHVDMDKFVNEIEVESENVAATEAWEPLELPWFPTSEVINVEPLGREDTTDDPGHRIRQHPGSSSPQPSRWHYKLPWSWKRLPRHVILAIDGGWYIVHLIYDNFDENEDLPSFTSRNNHLEISFYVPLILRDRPWLFQMCIVLPFWSTYIVFMVLYTFGPYRFFVYLLSPLASMTGTSQATQEPWMDRRYPLRVPAFFAGPHNTLNFQSRLKIWYTTFSLTSVFGAIHALGWSSHFPSNAEGTLWRISTVIICGVPPTVALWVMYRRSSFPQIGTSAAGGAGQGAPLSNVRRTYLYQLLQFLAARTARIGMPMYIFARVALITLAFTSLRSQPGDTYKNASWISAIPHL